MQYASKMGHMKGNYENLKKAQESKKIPVVAIKDGKQDSTNQAYPGDDGQ